MNIARLGRTTCLGLLLLSFGAFSSPVYRLPDSPIPSGEKNPKTLKHTGPEVLRSWARVSSPYGQGWMARDEIVKDIDLSLSAQTLLDTPFRLLPKEKAPPQGVIPKGSIIQLLHSLNSQRKDPWVQALWNRRTVWVDESALKTVSQDRGLVMTIQTSALLDKPHLKGKNIYKVTEGQRLKPLFFMPGWFQVETLSKNGKLKKGWVPLEKVISKVNFADQVTITSEKNSIQSVVSFENGELLLKNGQRLTLDKINKLETNSQLALVRSKKSKLLTSSLKTASLLAPVIAGERLSLLGMESVRWHQVQASSKEFYWTAELPASPVSNQPNLPVLKLKALNNEDVFSRPIYDAASSPVFSDLRLISANGIYRTFDGTHWEKLSHFGNNNYPIAISKSGDIFVGPYHSADQGNTFRPFIRWDHLMNVYIQSTGKHPHGIKMRGLEIKSIGNEEILITTLEEPSNVIYQFATKNFGLTWTFLNPGNGIPEEPALQKSNGPLRFLNPGQLPWERESSPKQFVSTATR